MTRLVPCNGCTLCCRGWSLVVVGSDEAIGLDTEPSPFEGLLKLKHKPNGDCVHLGAKGCEVYDRRPAICREYDCADQYRKTPRAERKRLIKSGMFSAAVFRRGREIAEATSPARPN